MSHAAAKRERIAAREASRHAAKRQAERGDARRCHPNRQWRPEGRLVNCCLPRILRTVEDFFSHARIRVIEEMTTKGPPGIAVRMPDNSWRVTISQPTLALRAGVCVKTVRNTLAQAIGSGLMTAERNMDGGRYLSTTYVIRPWKEYLGEIRKNPSYFHTAEGHVVGIGRNPRIMQPGEADVWKIKPQFRRTPPRSAGPRGGARPEAPHKATPEDIERVTDALRRAGTVADAGDAAKVIQAAIAAGRQLGVAGQIDAMLIEGLVLRIGRDYRPNQAFPVPAIGWFTKQLPGRIKAWARPPDARSRTG